MRTNARARPICWTEFTRSRYDYTRAMFNFSRTPNWLIARPMFTLLYGIWDLLQRRWTITLPVTFPTYNDMSSFYVILHFSNRIKIRLLENHWANLF